MLPRAAPAPQRTTEKIHEDLGELVKSGTAKSMDATLKMFEPIAARMLFLPRLRRKVPPMCHSWLQ